jgi:hypothetical protein
MLQIDSAAHLVAAKGSLLFLTMCFLAPVRFRLAELYRANDNSILRLPYG